MEEDRIRPVRFIVVEPVGGQFNRVLSGVTEAGIESRLSFKVAGTIATLPVKVGAVVAKGEVLASLDPIDYQLRLQEARANVSSAMAQRRNAEAEYRRVLRLYENQNAARSQLDAGRAAFETARAQVAAASKAASSAKQQLSYTTLRAPSDGAISAVPIEINENVSPGEPIAVLTSGKQAKVEVAVPESLIGQVKRGGSVTVTLDAMGGEAFAGTISEVGVSSARGTTFPVTIELDEENSEIRPGMATSVEFTFGDASGDQRIVLPPAAVAEDREGRFVYRLVRSQGDESFGTSERVPVEIGELTAAGLEITTGLVRGDNIITAGVTRITAGARVRVLEDQRK